MITDRYGFTWHFVTGITTRPVECDYKNSTVTVNLGLFKSLDGLLIALHYERMHIEEWVKAKDDAAVRTTASSP